MAEASRSQEIASCSSTRTASRPSAGEKQRTRRAEPATSAAAAVSPVEPSCSPAPPGSISATTTAPASPSGEKPKISWNRASVGWAGEPLTRSRRVRVRSRLAAAAARCSRDFTFSRERWRESSRTFSLPSRPVRSREVTGLSTYSKTLLLIAFWAYSNSSYPERITMTISG